MAELDKLEIVVTADTKGAESSISSLLRKLEELQQKISGLSGNGVGKKINGISKAFGKNGALKSIKAVSKQAAAYQEKLDLENFRQQNRLALEAVKQKNRLEQLSERARLSDARTAAKKAEREATKAAKEDPYWNDAALKARNEEALNRLFPTVQAVKTRIKGISSISAFRNGIFAKSDSQQAEDFRYHSSDYFNRARSRRYQQELSARSSTASNYDAGAENYTDKYNAVTDALHKVGATAKETQQRLAELHQEMGNNAGGVEIAQSFGIQESVFSRIGAALNSTMNQMPGFTNALASAFPVLSSLASAAGRLAMTGLGKFFQASISPIVSFGKRIQGVTSGVMGLFKQFKRLALLRLFRTAIAEIGKGLSTGINNLYQYSAAINGSFKSALDSAATSMQYFRNSIGAAAAPLIQAFIPYLNAAVSAIVSFINVISQLLAALGGAFKFTRAKRSLTEFGKAAGGAGGGAGKAAKEMDKFLASWDEITNIKTPNDSGGGGGGGGGAGEFLDMFEEAAIDPELLDFANRIREAFEAGRWEEVGKIIADKLNEIMPDDATFENWGRRFGEKINMAIGIALGFLRNFNFKALGSRLASFLNGGIDAVNWTNAGAYLWRRMSWALDMAIGFISTFDTGKYASAISDVMIGLWNEITAWLKETDWEEFGHIVGRKLMDMIRGIKWIELAQSMWELLKEAAAATFGFMKGFFSELFQDAFGSALGSILITVGGIAAAFKGIQFAKSFISNAKTVWNWVTGIWNKLFGSKGKSLSSPGLDIDTFDKLSKVDLSNLNPVQHLNTAQNFDTSALKDLANLNFNGLAPLSSLLSTFSSGAGIASLIGSAGLGLLSKILGGIASLDFSKSKSGVDEVTEEIKKAQSEVDKIAEAAKKARESAKTEFDGLKTDISTVISDMQTSVSESLTGIGEEITGFLNTVRENVKGLPEALLEDLSGVPEQMHAGILAPMEESVVSFVNRIETFVLTRLDNFKTSLTGFPEWLYGTVLSAVELQTSTLMNRLSTFITTQVDNLKSNLAGIPEWLYGTILVEVERQVSTAVARIDTFIRTKTEAIKTFLAALPAWFSGTILNDITESISAAGQTARAIVEEVIDGIESSFSQLPGYVYNIVDQINGALAGIERYIVITIETRYIETYAGSSDTSGSFDRPGGSRGSSTGRRFASGGFPTEGEMFIAREAGPELVGRMGSRSAVANNDQIVDGIRQGVYEAMVAANNGQNSREVKVYIDGKDITDYTRKRSNQMARALGV